MEQEKTLAESKWPKLEEIKVNPDLANKLKRKIVIQVNGKKKALIEVKNEETKSVVFKEAMKNNNLREIVSGKHFKIIFIKNKVMNIVLDSEVKN
jgi:leucyl-tRNA synthetase